MPTLLRHATAASLLALATLTLLTPGRALAQDIELYPRDEFRGAPLRLFGADAQVQVVGGHGTRIGSLVVRSGNWELCNQTQYRGQCARLGPGRYPRLPQGLDERVASLRPLVAAQPGQPPWASQPGRPGVGTGRPAIVLHGAQSGSPGVELFEAQRNLASIAFNDSATHAEVRSGVWELCSDGGFGGTCQRFAPGRHELPPSLRHRLSSLRPVDGLAAQPVRPPVLPVPPVSPVRPDGPSFGQPWPGAAPAIVFYEHSNGNGRELPLSAAVANFHDAGFNDEASSVEVFRGRWQLCRDAGFGGECIVLGPGRHELQGRWNDAVSSVRPVGRQGDQPLGSRGAVTLHDQVALRGDTLQVDDAVNNLRYEGFNDRAVAIEVHGGRWQLCSDAGYRGQCRDFGPGWHRLPDDLARQVSSLRPR